jgi:hypothetical protein
MRNDMLLREYQKELLESQREDGRKLRWNVDRVRWEWRKDEDV